MKPSRLPPPQRPQGTGAFWDYAEASARQQDQRTARRRTTDSILFARRAADGERAEQRWDNEGGKTNGA